MRPAVSVTDLDLGPHVVVFVTDAAGTILDVNRAFAEVTGYGRDEAIGATPRLLRSGRQDDEVYEDLWGTITRGSSWAGELVDRHRDGTFHTHEVSITPVRDAVGRIDGFVAVQRDLTADLAEQVGSHATGTVHTDQRGRCTYADDRAGVLLDRRGDALLREDGWSSLDPDDAAAFTAAASAVAAGERSRHLLARTLAGRILLVLVDPLRHGDRVSGTRCRFEDVTHHPPGQPAEA